MEKVQTFEWFYEARKVAILEVRHYRRDMTFTVRGVWIEAVRAKMNALNNGDDGTYSVGEFSHTRDLSADFFISAPYNWDKDWLEFRSIIDQLLGMTSSERSSTETG